MLWNGLQLDIKCPLSNVLLHHAKELTTLTPDHIQKINEWSAGDIMNIRPLHRKRTGVFIIFLGYEEDYGMKKNFTMHLRVSDRVQIAIKIYLIADYPVYKLLFPQNTHVEMSIVISYDPVTWYTQTLLRGLSPLLS